MSTEDETSKILMGVQGENSIQPKEIDAQPIEEIMDIWMETRLGQVIGKVG